VPAWICFGRGCSTLGGVGTKVYALPGGALAFTGAENWDSAAAAPPDVVTSVFTRTGAVAAVSGDYAASLVSNDSAVPGADVQDALDALLAGVVAAGKPTANNKIMAASLTAADFSLACATAITSTPAGGSYVAVAINGVLQSVGSGVRTQSCYFSNDGGATARAFGAIVAGDNLYWVGSVAGFQLATTDQVDFYYDA